jgi:hypothetical protein
VGMGNEHPKPREVRVNEEQTHPWRQCPIKAQAAASVGRTGPSLDYAKKGALDDPFPAARKKGRLRAPPALRMLSCPDLPRP